MDNQRRRLALLGGVGALALLAQSQQAEADTGFTSFSFAAASAPTNRTMPDRLDDVVNVKDWGAVGDGSNDDTAAIQAAFDFAYGTAASPHGTNYKLNRPVFFPNGNYKITSAGSGQPCLTLTNVQGAHIFGAGRFTTTLTCATAGGIHIKTDGFQYGCIEHLYFSGPGAGSTNSIGLALEHTSSGNFAVQQNSLENLVFDGIEKGIDLASLNDGASYGQGSETTIKNCFFGSCHYGLYVGNANAVDNTIIGGNCQGCTYGIYIVAGSVNFVGGVSFQTSSTADIYIASQARNTMFVSGCRTESSNFINNAAGQRVTISGCQQFTSGTRGYFFNTVSSVGHIQGCLFNGQIIPSGSSVLCIQACEALDESISGDWLSLVAANMSVFPACRMEVENVTSYTGTDSVPVVDQQLTKVRYYTTDQMAITTKTYTVS